MFSDDAHLLEGAPRLFGIVADAEEAELDEIEINDVSADRAHVVAWGHELPDQAVLTWRLGNGGCEIAVFSSAEAALATAQLLYPARLLWIQPPQPAQSAQIAERERGNSDCHL